MATEGRSRPEIAWAKLLGLLWASGFTALLVAYRVGHPTVSMSVALWEVLESGIVKVLSTGAVLPAALLLVENRLKILQAYRDRTEESTRQNKAERTRRAEERKRKCEETVHESLKDMERFFRELERVAYFDPRTETAERVLLDLYPLGDLAANLPGAWRASFPALKETHIDPIKYLLWTVYLVNWTVCELIRCGRIEGQVPLFRDAVYVINEVFWNLGRQFVNEVLRVASTLDAMDNDDSEERGDAYNHLKNRLMDEYEKVLNSSGSDVARMARVVLLMQCNRNEDLPHIQTSEAVELRARQHDLSRRATEAADVSPQAASAYAEAFRRIPIADRLAAARLYYSPTFVLALADFCNDYVRAHGHEGICGDVAKGRFVDAETATL